MVGGKKFTVIGYQKSIFEDKKTNEKTVTNKVYLNFKVDDAAGKGVTGLECGVAYPSDDLFEYIELFDPGTEFTGVITRKKGQFFEIGCIFDN